MRERDQSQMRETRMEVSRLLELQKSELKEISNSNKTKIREIKEKQMLKNM